MKTLEVWLHDRNIGTIVQTRQGGRFAYNSEIVHEYSGAPLLSLCFPVKAKPFAESKTSNWFEGLLPEGNRRTQICRSLGISEYDWLSLIAEIGWECAGAVRIFESGTNNNAFARKYVKISQDELVHHLSDIALRMPKPLTATYRMSLGGFQEKMCVAMPCFDDALNIDLDAIHICSGDAASTHILKPENTHIYPGSVESEAWAMTAARRAARCSKVAVLQLPDAPDTLVVERYDRVEQSWPTCVQRVHQEDICQALGIAPNRKYASQPNPRGDDPTYKAIANLLQRYSSNPVAEMRELLRQIVVNIVLGNWDAHAKNTSFLYLEPMNPCISPLYDVLPIADIEKRTDALSMRIDGLINPAGITKQNIVNEAKSWGLLESDARFIIEECRDALHEGIKSAGTIYPQAAKRHEAGALVRLKSLA